MKRRALAALVIAIIGVGGVGAAAQEPGINLLTNPSMEGDYGAWGGIPQLQMPSGWEPWWTEWPHDAEWQNLRPEFSESTTWAGYWNRVHEGAKAMRYFKGWGTFTGGAKQTVGGVTPGVMLEFTAWGHAWHCEDWNACHEDQESGPPRVWSYPPEASVFMRIGIDPTGGSDPFSGNVVWSGGISALDYYRQFSVRTTARSDRVTVFLWASQNTPAENQDAYWDDASLVVVGPGGEGSVAVAGQTAPEVVPVTTVMPDGTTVHIVQPGDTLSGIAAAYNMTLADLRALNGLGPNDNLIFSGQKIIVRGMPAPAAQPTATPTLTPTPVAVASAFTGQGLIAFVSASMSDADAEIYLLDLATRTGAPTPLTDNTADDTAPAWSPDGQRLAFASDRDGDYDIYVVDLACRAAGCTENDAVRVTDSPAADLNPSWSSDGEYLVFQSDREGDWNLYLLSLADGQVARLFDSVSNGEHPALQPGSAFSLSAASTSAGGAAAPVNLLANPDFEDETVDFAGDGYLMVPTGWSPWWVDQPSGCDGVRPAFNVAAQAHRGAQAATVLVEGQSFTGGLYQTVTAPQGSTVRFTIWGYVLSNADDPQAIKSSEGASVEMRVGINPEGGFNPLASSVVWSESVDAPGEYTRFDVSAVAQSDRVTVFTWTKPAACNAINQAFWDAGSLTVAPR